MAARRSSRTKVVVDFVLELFRDLLDETKARFVGVVDRPYNELMSVEITAAEDGSNGGENGEMVRTKS